MQTLIENEPVIVKLSKDLRQASLMMSDDEVRYLVNSYYIVQKDRMRADAQVREKEKDGEPCSVLRWTADNYRLMEASIRTSLDVYSKNHIAGEWARGILGVGPVIASGFFAHVDIRKATTAGHIWTFAGIDGKSAWLGGLEAEKMVRTFIDGGSKISVNDVISVAKKVGCCPKWYARRIAREADNNIDLSFRGLPEQLDEEYVRIILKDREFTKNDMVSALSRRPWNADLKTLCWKLGQCFVYVSGNENSYYGRIYKERKELDRAKNESKAFSKDAEYVLSMKKIGKDTEAFSYYSSGMLPPAQIHARAKRFAVKIFISHLYEVWRTKAGLPVMRPYMMEIKGHPHKMEIPVS